MNINYKDQKQLLKNSEIRQKKKNLAYLNLLMKSQIYMLMKKTKKFKLLINNLANQEKVIMMKKNNSLTQEKVLIVSIIKSINNIKKKQILQNLLYNIHKECKIMKFKEIKMRKLTQYFRIYKIKIKDLNKWKRM